MATSDQPALVDSIVAETLTAIRHFRCSGAGRLTREGISIAHLHVLWLLEEHGDLPMSRVAELLGVSLSNATGLIDRMEERGLVERLRVPDDRRLVLVRITAHGSDTVNAMDVLRKDILQGLLARLDPEQLVRLRQTIRDLSGALLQSIESGEGAGGCPDSAIGDQAAEGSEPTRPVPVPIH